MAWKAIQKTAELTPDLILLDISLPKLSGIEAARQIRKIAPSSKILFVSTYEDLDIVEAANTGASGYVVKVDAGKELARAMEAVFQGKRLVSSTYSVDEDTQATAGFGPTETLVWPSATIRSHEAQFYSDDVVFRAAPNSPATMMIACPPGPP
jgi:DNA-binding NarL/FixJ family response regulator